VFADHGADGSGEPLAITLRPGNAGSNTAGDHITSANLALAQLPAPARRRVLVRAGSGGGTHAFLAWLTAPRRRLAYSVGFSITEEAQHTIMKIPAWTPAYDGDGQVRDGAWVAELIGMLDLAGWPKRMRVIVRKGRPHPGAQLRFTDIRRGGYPAAPCSPMALVPRHHLVLRPQTGIGHSPWVPGSRTARWPPSVPGSRQVVGPSAEEVTGWLKYWVSESLTTRCCSALTRPWLPCSRAL
jgi:hypothetical protein